MSLVDNVKDCIKEHNQQRTRIEQLERELAAMTKERDALRADAERLDWLQKQGAPVTVWDGSPNHDPELVAYEWRVEDQSMDVRIAIDAAMKGEG